MIWIAISIYTITAIALGWYANKKTEDGAGFWTAGRNLGATSVGLSISAGFMSVSWSCVYAVQLFYWYGLGAVWLITIPWLIALTGIYFLSKKYHALTAFSQPEMVGNRFGLTVKRTVAFALAFVFLVWGGAEIYVAAHLLAPELEISIPVTIIGICIVVGIYATLGGFRAVVATDKFQYFIVALYILVMTSFAMKGLWQKNNSLLPPLSTITYKSSLSWINLSGPGILTILISFIAYLPGWLFETDLWIRVQAARSQVDARKGMIIAGVNALFFVGVLPFLIGVAALILFPPVDGIVPELIGNEGDAIFVALVQQYAPSWLALLAAIGLVAAAMSTIDTCINVMALSIAYDFFSLHKYSKGRKYSQVVTVAAIIAAGIFALFTESLWDIFYLSGGILTTAVAFPVAAIFIPGVRSEGVKWSAIFGLIGTTVAYFLQINSILVLFQPDWLSASDLAYILWGIISAILGYFAGILIKFK